MGKGYYALRFSVSVGVRDSVRVRLVLGKFRVKVKIKVMFAV